MRLRLAPLFRARRARTADPRLIRAAEIALAIAIGAVLWSIVWNVFGPISRPSVTPRPSTVPAAAAPDGPIDPFRMASASPPAPASELEPGPDLAETTLNLVLHGTWITSDGGAAFIKTPDEKQGRYAVGDAITNGVTLERVYRDQVVINRNGARESLRLINREPVAAAGGASAPAQENKIQSNISGLASIGQLITAQPELDDVGNVRLVLEPTGDKEAFEELGLRTGDTLVAVDNRPIGPDIAAGLNLIAAIEGKPSVTITVERDGVVMPVTIALPPAVEGPNDQE